MILTDDFKPNHIRYQGLSFRCPEHAQWYVLFKTLRLEFEYMPERFKLEIPGTERYKKGSETTVAYYEPTFHIDGIGYVHIVDLQPLSYTMCLAERLSDQVGEDVYFIEGAPVVSRTYLGTNMVTIVRPQSKPKRLCRVLHDGKDLYFSAHYSLADLMSTKLVDAFLMAEMLQSSQGVDRVDSDPPAG